MPSSHPSAGISRRALLHRLGVAAVASLAVPATVAGQPKRGGILKFALNTDPPKLDPASSGPTGSIDAVCSIVYNRLVNYKPDASDVIPDLSERWEISRAAKCYTFFLRKAFMWHSGKEL